MTRESPTLASQLPGIEAEHKPLSCGFRRVSSGEPKETAARRSWSLDSVNDGSVR